MSETSPPLQAVLDRIIRSHLYGVRVCLPGRIEAYDTGKQMATVQPLVQDPIPGGDELGNRAVETLPAIAGVPVFFAGGGGARLTFPVARGDIALLVFASSSIDRWLAGTGGIVDPGDTRRHNLSDAIAIVGLHTFGAPPTSAPADATVLHRGTKDIKLGSPAAAQSAMRGDAFHTAMNTLLSAIITAVGATGGTTSGAAAATLTTAVNTFNAAWATYLSSHVKVE